MILFQEQSDSNSILLQAAASLAVRAGFSGNEDEYLRVFLDEMRGCLEFDSISDETISEVKRFSIENSTLEDVDNFSILASAFLATQKQIIDRDERFMNREGFAAFELDSARKHCYLVTKYWVASVERCLAYARMCAKK